MKIPIVFRVDTRKGEIRDVVAVFLQEANNREGDQLTCYQHMGQHGGCAISWLYQCTRPATSIEYRALLSELRSIYEGDDEPDSLVIKNRLPSLGSTIKALQS